MFKYTKIGALLLFIMLSVCSVTKAVDTTTLQVGIDEKLGETIPLDLSFLDETGKPVSLRSLITKPTLLTGLLQVSGYMQSVDERRFISS